MVQLVDFNPQDGVRLGLTALPNAAADAAGGLTISDAGGLDLDARLDAAVSTRASQASVDAVDDFVDTEVAAILVDTAVIGTPAGASLSADVAAIEAQTDDIGVAGAGLTEAGGTGDHLTAVPWNASWDTEVESEVNDGLVAVHLDHLLATDYDPAAKPGTATALLNELVESDAGVSRYTINALENAPSGSGASAEAIADAVWDEDIVAAHATADTSGLILSQLTKRSVTFSTAVISGSVVDQFADDGTATFDRTTDSLQALADSGGGGLTQQQVRDSMKLAPTVGAPAAGSVDEHLDDILTDTGTTLQGEVDGIQADTEDIQSRLPAALVAGRIDASVGAMAAGVVTSTAIATDAVGSDELAAGAVTEIQSGLATAAAVDAVDNFVDTEVAAILASVDTEVADILTDTAVIGAPAGASVSADIAAVKSDTAAILVDTGTTLQAEIDGIQADTEDLQ
ncbi:MAG: hypothetical protein L0206_26085, partial [Actinobacteria bacterium]|nr:hypothetical protein [Actinomycetota bacterium]